MPQPADFSKFLKNPLFWKNRVFEKNRVFWKTRFFEKRFINDAPTMIIVPPKHHWSTIRKRSKSFLKRCKTLLKRFRIVEKRFIFTFFIGSLAYLLPTYFSWILRFSRPKHNFTYFSWKLCAFLEKNSHTRLLTPYYSPSILTLNLS